MDASSPNEPLHDCASAEPPSDSPEKVETAPEAKAAGESAPESPVEAPKVVAEPSLDAGPRMLIPWIPQARANAAPETAVRLRVSALALAASLATFAIVVVGGLAITDHREQAAALAAKTGESQALVASLSELKARLDALEATRARDESAEMRKIAADVKAAAASTRDVGATLAQINGRIDRIEKDQGARIDKVSEKVDHDASARFADMAARLDKLEKKFAAPTVATAAPTPPPPPPAPGKAPAFSNVSNDTTGAIDRPKAILRGYTLEDIEGNMAVIDGRDGPMTVGVGDAIPGAGRVLKIDRHGRDWAVITTQGQIVTEPGAY